MALVCSTNEFFILWICHKSENNADSPTAKTFGKSERVNWICGLRWLTSCISLKVVFALSSFIVCTEANYWVCHFGFCIVYYFNQLFRCYNVCNKIQCLIGLVCEMCVCLINFNILLSPSVQELFYPYCTYISIITGSHKSMFWYSKLKSTLYCV